MTPIKRSLGAVGAAVLLAATLSACGGGPPTDASKGDFCDDVVNAEPDLSGLDPEASPEEQAKAFKEELDKITEKAEEIGTPEDIPDDAREGFEITIDKANDLDEGDLEKAIEDQDEDFFDVSDDEQDKLDAFNEWSQEYCA
jgi:hypothetical protein